MSIVKVTRDAHGPVGLIVLDKPGKCGCGRVVALLRNREGKTRCVECDDRYTASGATAAERIAKFSDL